MLRSRTIDVRGVRSPVLEAGPADAAEGVVFVHGNPGGAVDWTRLMRALGADVRSAAPDMPGFAGADRPRELPYTVDGYAAHLGGLIDALGLARVHLVAHDFGGIWSLRWAADQPERVASVTLLDTGALVGYRWHRLARVWRTPLAGDLFLAVTRPALVRAILRRENPRLPAREAAIIAALLAPRATRRAVRKLYRATDPQQPADVIPALRPHDLPALVVFGADDPYVPAEQAALQREAFPSAQVEVLPGLGHWPYYDDPPAVAALVVPFVRARLGVAPVPTQEVPA
jgi:pimeloyl-ACP methyl ester carboxylesterase